MTEIERKALALLNEACAEMGLDKVRSLELDMPGERALLRAIEQHEAYRQEVSDAVKNLPAHIQQNFRLSRFIIAKPDPLVEVLAEVTGQGENYTDERDADAFRTALAARGGRIVFDQPEGGAA